MKRQIPLRVLLCAQTLMVAGIAIYEPRSLNYAMVQSGGVEAYASLAILSVLALLALADVVINDILPHDWESKWCFQHRHLLWAGMGCTFAAYAFVLSRQHVGAWLAATFAVYAVGCMAVAFFDLHYRALK